MRTVRAGRIGEIDRLMEIYRDAREIMLSCGNVNQWAKGYPTREMILDDIVKDRNRVIVDDGVVVGSFAFIPGKDPTYDYVEGGAWLEDTLPYCTIHRLASCKGVSGIASTCFNWSWEQCQNLRVDTHEDNVIMRHCIEKAGFKKCGIIYLLSGAPRVAYQKVNI